MKKIAFLLLLASLFGCYARDPVTTGQEGKLLPAFDMLLADSVTHLNTKNIPGDKPIVFFYFGPYCPYSRAQMDEIIQDMDILKDMRFYLLTYAPYGQMKDFYNHYALGKYPNITVGLDTARFFKNFYEIEGVPYLAVYGKDKRLKKAFIGEVYGRQIKRSGEE